MTREMTKTSLFLALIPIMALAAACSGPAPTAPTDLDGSALVGSSGSGTVTAMASPCAAITGIKLKVDDSSRTFLWVEATYQYISSGFVVCPAPAWSSDRQEMIVDRANPFRAGFSRSVTGRAILKAAALNGVTNSIRVELGGSGNCHNIVAVNLKVVENPLDDAFVWVQAAYVFLGDTPDNCADPPTFAASRKGLRIHPSDLFRAGIATAAPGIKTSVSAAAPNGVAAKIRF